MEAIMICSKYKIKNVINSQIFPLALIYVDAKFQLLCYNKNTEKYKNNLRGSVLSWTVKSVVALFLRRQSIVPFAEQSYYRFCYGDNLLGFKITERLG